MGRQLQESPDVGGNQKLIKQHKNELALMAEQLMEQMQENQTFSTFKAEIDNGLESQDKFEKLRNTEKELNNEIKNINDSLKRKQDEFAKEAQESSDDIIRLKKNVNETKTQAELEVQYKKREIEGRLACKKRLNSIEETELRNKIVELRKKIDMENLVSAKVRDFITKKKEIIDKKAEERDKLKETKTEEL